LHFQGAELRETRFESGVVDFFGMKLEADPLIDAHGQHPVDVAGTRAEGQAVEGVNGALALVEPCFGALPLAGSDQPCGRKRHQYDCQRDCRARSHPSPSHESPTSGLRLYWTYEHERGEKLPQVVTGVIPAGTHPLFCESLFSIFCGTFRRKILRVNGLDLKISQWRLFSAAYEEAISERCVLRSFEKAKPGRRKGNSDGGSFPRPIGLGRAPARPIPERQGEISKSEQPHPVATRQG
jgi:hypothetical protein